MRIVLAHKIEALFWLSLISTVICLFLSEFAAAGVLFVLTVCQFQPSFITTKFSHATKRNIVQLSLKIVYFFIPKKYIVLELKIIEVAFIRNRGAEVTFICSTEAGYVISTVNKEQTSKNLKQAVLLLSKNYQEEIDRLR